MGCATRSGRRLPAGDCKSLGGNNNEQKGHQCNAGCFHGCQPGRLRFHRYFRSYFRCLFRDFQHRRFRRVRCFRLLTYGNAVKNAEELAVKEINAANGSDVFDWKFEDDEHDAEKSVNAYNSLKDWGMQVLAGPVTTTPTLAVAAESVNDNMFVMTPSASAQTVIETGDNVFQICFTDPNQGVASADYIAENALATKIGVIYDSSDAYSSGIYAKFKTEAESKGLEIVTAEAFTSDNKSDLSTQVAKCQEAGAAAHLLHRGFSDPDHCQQDRL